MTLIKITSGASSHLLTSLWQVTYDGFETILRSDVELELRGDNILTLTGHDFAINAQGKPIRGVVTGMVLGWVLPVFEFSDLEIDVLELFRALKDPTFERLLKLLGDIELVGGDGDDGFGSGPGDDSLTGQGGDDILSGRAGDDTLDGGAGRDDLIGGDGNDLLLSQGDFDIIDGGAGIDTLRTSGEVYHYLAEVEVVRVIGDAPVTIWGSTNSAISIYGNGAANQLYGSYKDDKIVGNAGNDTLGGGDGSDSLSGGEGNDELFVGFSVGHETLLGGAGDDTLQGALTDDEIQWDLFFGGPGDDYYFDVWAHDRIVEKAGQGDDTVVVLGEYTLPGAVEHLVLASWLDGEIGRGNDQDNSIQGLYVSKRLLGMGGDDTLTGSAWNDTLEGGEGRDDLIGGDRTDFASYEDSKTSLRVDFASPGRNTGVSKGDTFDDIEGLIGSRHADTLLGNAGRNILFGQAGSDSLVGRDGGDLLAGGLGADTLDGGSGDDKFLFLKPDEQLDHIVRFASGADKIQIDSGFDPDLAWGRLKLDVSFFIDKQPRDDNTFAYSTKTNTLSFVTQDGDGELRLFDIASFAGGTVLDARDIVVLE